MFPGWPLSGPSWSQTILTSPTWRHLHAHGGYGLTLQLGPLAKCFHSLDSRKTSYSEQQPCLVRTVTSSRKPILAALTLVLTLSALLGPAWEHSSPWLLPPTPACVSRLAATTGTGPLTFADASSKKA